MNINLNYSAPDIESLCAAIQAVRALGLVPTVSATPPPRASVGKPPGASEPNVDAYLSGRQAAGFPATIFRVWKSEKVRGLSREQAAAERMTVDGWQTAQGPQDEREAPSSTSVEIDESDI